MSVAADISTYPEFKYFIGNTYLVCNMDSFKNNGYYEDATLLTAFPPYKESDLFICERGINNGYQRDSTVPADDFEQFAITFGEQLWSEFDDLMKNKKTDKAHFILHKNLRDEAKNRQNFTNCDTFLFLAINQDLSSDTIFHILKTLSPYKENLENWQSFFEKSRNVLIDKRGHTVAENLLKSI